MSNVFLSRLVRLLLLVALQVMILNHVHLFGYATALVVGYMVVRFHFGSSRSGLLLWGFATGLIYDMFSNTMGMGMASLTLLAMLQPVLLGLFKPRDASDDFVPSIKSMGVLLYLPYLVISMLILHLAFYALEAFSVANLELSLMAIVGGTLVSSLLIFFVEIMLNSVKQE